MLLREDLEFSTLLSNVIKEARSVTGARYGALGILNEQGTRDRGVPHRRPDGRRRAANRASSHGEGCAWSAPDRSPRSLRLARLDAQPEKPGFPLHHPTMTSFLGVPIEVRDEIYGSLYLTDKLGAPGFTAEDEALVEALAAAAGMAIENARLHQQIQGFAVIEDATGWPDLHDTVVQHLYTVGITLETMAREPEAASLADRLAVVVADVGDAMRQVRSSIYELGLDEEDPGTRASVIALVRSLAPVLGFKAKVLFDGPIDTVISQSVAEQLLATVREAVTNVGRHAQATETSVTVSAAGGLCRSQRHRQRGWD